MFLQYQVSESGVKNHTTPTVCAAIKDLFNFLLSHYRWGGFKIRKNLYLWCSSWYACVLYLGWPSFDLLIFPILVISSYIFCFAWWFVLHLTGLWNYSWLWDQGLLLTNSGPNGVLGIKSSFTAWNTNTLNAILSLHDSFIFFEITVL